MKESTRKHVVIMSLFCASGIAHPLIISKISYLGGSEPSTLLYLIPSSFGLCLCSIHLWLQARRARHNEEVIEAAPSILNTLVIGHNENRSGDYSDVSVVDDLIPTHHRRVGMNHLNHTPWLRLVLLCICDMASSCMHMLGLLLAGSSIFIMAYSSVTITTAIMSRIYLQRHMHWVQWIGLFIIAGGLSISGIVKGSIGQGVAVHSPVNGEHAFSDAYPTLTDGSYSNIGVVMIMLASFMHAFCYVLTESLMTVDKVSPEMLCSCLGFSSMTIYSIWQLWWTIPRWKELVTIPVEMHGGQITLTLCLYLFLMVNNLTHSLCFFHFVVELGSVSVSVIKGLQSVALFVLSNALFCSPEHPTQCWSAHKGFSLGVTLVGVVVFNAFKLPSESEVERERQDLSKEAKESIELLQLNALGHPRYSYDSITSSSTAADETLPSGDGGTSKETTHGSQQSSGSGEEEKDDWRL